MIPTRPQLGGLAGCVSCGVLHACCLQAEPLGPRPNIGERPLSSEILALPRTHECFSLIEGDGRLDYSLPKPNVTAGQVLKHCYEALDGVLRKENPCIYKVGYTHCASFRLYNKVYGYAWERDKWERMLVIYASNESISPAFVEGALIQREMGALPWFPKSTPIDVAMPFVNPCSFSRAKASRGAATFAMEGSPSRRGNLDLS